ncbi:MAG TPA: hypothetical protein VMU05_01535 [Dongiaceae bacterium]|nr:hypothetical protein [Dongiaceae bacterium]
MLTVYRQLLRLYPAEYREVFGDEIMTVLAEARDQNANRKVIARLRILLRESAGLVTGALRERFNTFIEMQAELSIGRFTMRNGFRFPKSTIIFMALILAGVVMAIQRGEQIAVSLPHVNPQIGPIQPVHSTLLPPIVLFLLLFYLLGFVGWAIVFALRRSGIHRLADMSGQPK